MPIPQGYSKFLERNADQLRQMCEVGPFERLDPFRLATEMKMDVRFVGKESGLPEDLLESVLGACVENWDAGTIKFPDGRIHVYMNPQRDPLRQRATLMEEVSHIHLGHTPTEIFSCGEVVFRTCNKTNENHAYWVGAAALLPLRILKGARTRRMSMVELASAHQVSVDLVKFRCKINGVDLVGPVTVR